MAISRLSTSRVTQGLPKFQSAWDQDNVEAGALVPIANAVGNGTAASMVFSNVPQGYRDLKIIVNGRSTHATYTTYSVYLNATGFNGWSFTLFKASNSTVSSSRSLQSTPSYGWISDAASALNPSGIFNASCVYIYDYSNTSKNTVVLGQNALEDGTNSITELNVGTWANTAAVTTIEVATNGNWVSGSTATLYGIKASA